MSDEHIRQEMRDGLKKFFESNRSANADKQRAASTAAVTDYWMAHYVSAPPHSLCTLCGNSGTIDTTKTAISAAGVNAGRVSFCICPNGQALRKRTP
jgi:hypothetical protein